MKVYEAWLDAESDPIRRLNVSDVLLEIGDGSWSERREWVEDLFDVRIVHILAAGNLFVSMLVPIEYPTFGWLVRIGPLVDR